MDPVSIREAMLVLTALQQTQSLYFTHLSNTGFHKYANSVYRQRFIRPGRPIDDHNFTEIIHPDDKGLALEIFYKALEHPGMPLEITVRKYAVDDSLIYSRWMAVSMIEPSTGEPEIVCIGFDISPLNVEAELLEDATQKLKAMVNSTSDQSFLITKKGVVMGFNQMAQKEMKRLLGISMVAGHQFLDFFEDDAQRKQVSDALELAARGRPTTAEFKQKFAGGQSHWYRTEITPVYNADSEVTSISINVSDIDMLKRSQLHLQHQNAHLMEIAQMQSHHIRRPIANIKGLLHLLRHEVFSDEVKQYVDLLEESAEDADAVIREVVAKTVSARAVPE